MEAVIFIGVQGSGKTTFYKERLFETHVRVSRDMLKTRHREDLLIAACLAGKQPFVVDDTNSTRSQRAPHIAAAKAAGFRVIGCYFRAELAQALQRNRQRPKNRVVPPAAVVATHKRLEPPSLSEGFDEISIVEIDATGDFVMREGEASGLSSVEPGGEKP